MSDDGSKLLESLMGSLGDNPAETIGQMLFALNTSQKNGEETKKESEEPAMLPGGLDMESLLKMQKLMSAVIKNGQDDRDKLLCALKPFLSEERRPQVDRAIQFLKLSQMAKTAQEMDLFGKLL